MARHFKSLWSRAARRRNRRTAAICPGRTGVPHLGPEGQHNSDGDMDPQDSVKKYQAKAVLHSVPMSIRQIECLSRWLVLEYQAGPPGPPSEIPHRGSDR